MIQNTVCLAYLGIKSLNLSNRLNSNFNCNKQIKVPKLRPASLYFMLKDSILYCEVKDSYVWAWGTGTQRLAYWQHQIMLTTPYVEANVLNGFNTLHHNSLIWFIKC